jgi:hypothetical protein
LADNRDNLLKRMLKMGVQSWHIGGGCDSLRRDKFDEALEPLRHPPPKGKTFLPGEEAVSAANISAIGAVRPSIFRRRRNGNCDFLTLI